MSIEMRNRSGVNVGSDGCNSDICCAYFLSIIASALFVGGVYIAFIQWNHLWLSLCIIAITLILLGSCMYYKGTRYRERHSQQYPTNSRESRSRNRNRGMNDIQLMPSAPPLSDSRSVSQFSLNMMPQYFSAMDSESLASNITSQSISAPKGFSQIVNVKGQSYLILPISGHAIATGAQYQAPNVLVHLQDSDNPPEDPRMNKNIVKDILDLKPVPTQSDLNGCKSNHVDHEMQSIPRQRIGHATLNSLLRRDQTMKTLPLAQSDITNWSQKTLPQESSSGSASFNSNKPQVEQVLEKTDSKELQSFPTTINHDSPCTSTAFLDSPLIDFNHEIPNTELEVDTHPHSMQQNEMYNFDDDDDYEESEELIEDDNTPPPSYDDVLTHVENDVPKDVIAHYEKL